MAFYGTLDLISSIELLQIARNTLENFLQNKNKPKISVQNKILEEKAGTFVTLHKNNNLRGCIGNFSDHLPMWEMVQDMAIAAALDDPRFKKVTYDELQEIDIEISVLSGLSPILADQVKVGVHGLFITYGFHRGVLLPQVPVEWGWDREEFLREVSIKAGLPPKAWTFPEAKLESFTAQVFSEKELLH